MQENDQERDQDQEYEKHKTKNKDQDKHKPKHNVQSQVLTSSAMRVFSRNSLRKFMQRTDVSMWYVPFVPVAWWEENFNTHIDTKVCK